MPGVKPKTHVYLFGSLANGELDPRNNPIILDLETPSPLREVLNLLPVPSARVQVAMVNHSKGTGGHGQPQGRVPGSCGLSRGSNSSLPQGIRHFCRLEGFPILIRRPRHHGRSGEYLFPCFPNPLNSSSSLHSSNIRIAGVLEIYHCDGPWDTKLLPSDGPEMLDNRLFL
jgi:hypothetical protein